MLAEYLPEGFNRAFSHARLSSQKIGLEFPPLSISMHFVRFLGFSPVWASMARESQGFAGSIQEETEHSLFRT